ncbi:Aste57867_13785 [Aphanomyces stellatus]|uniref:peptidylprolyl isomerase n=1 Tax=Aphanomyces stellatus TaxID=120398 RepID=A0A485KZX5_9STRA|nr:hypothetical protein As57867_013735 [Aphanomyces stellatus]VFT90617.1 Aste57867_13785 [Aphanomyces stellatus]
MMSSSVTWEKVSHLSVQDELQMQLLNEQANLTEAKAHAERNDQGIDIEQGRAAGTWSISVLGAEEVNLDGVLDLAGQTTIVGTLSIAASAVEKGKAYPRMGKTDAAPVDAVTKRCFWSKDAKSTVQFTGVKSKSASVTLTLHHPSPLVADVFIGTCKLDLADLDLLDQTEKRVWVPLAGPPGQSPTDGASYGQVHVALLFEYDRIARLERAIAALAAQKARVDADTLIYEKTAPLVQAESRHPAAFGQAALGTGLYIPGHKFNGDTFHPAAVHRTPLADGTKVVTPFGRGTVVTFRESTRMYVVLMAASPGQEKRYTTAYLREDCVEDEPEVPRLRPGVAVLTPYGAGEIIEVRRRDGVIAVQTAFATMFMQPTDVTMAEGVAAKDMTNKERIETAVTASADGNAAFKADALDDAVAHYLTSLEFLKHVDQDAATHKEKAVVLQTMIRCHLNLAACKLKLQGYADAWTACTNALAILQALTENRTGKVAAWMGRLGMTEAQIFNEWPSKARFRRATALIAMDKDDEAKQDLLAAVKLMPKDKACRQLLEAVTKRVALEKEREKLKWGGFLAKEAEPKGTHTAVASKKPASPVVAPKKAIEAESATAAAWYENTSVVAALSVAVAGAAVLLISGLSKRNQ